MPALTSITISGAAPLGRALLALGRRFKQLADRLRNRRDAMRLAELDDRMLGDIGLTRSDLRDAFAELPWRDPSDVLAQRAAERRGARRPTDVGRALSYPSLSRPARYLM
jgi:uncharacterized protein YjiS (DUF1127 family)